MPLPSSSSFDYTTTVGKTLDDVINDNDKRQFSKLKTDEEKYDMIKGMITGVERNPIFKISDSYVNGDVNFKDLAIKVEEKLKLHPDLDPDSIYENIAIETKVDSFDEKALLRLQEAFKKYNNCYKMIDSEISLIKKGVIIKSERQQQLTKKVGHLPRCLTVTIQIMIMMIKVH